jgi:hypothetical protein
MKEYIAQWIKSQPRMVVLSHKTVRSLFYYEIFDFMGTDGKYYKFNVVYNDARILGTISSLGIVNAIEGEVDSGHFEQDVNQILDGLLVKYETKDELAANRSKELSKEQLDELVMKYLNSITSSLLNVKTESFQIQDVELVSNRFPLFTIYFTYQGRTQVPFRLTVSEPSLVKVRKYGEESQEFHNFVERLGKISGGIVWY